MLSLTTEFNHCRRKAHEDGRFVIKVENNTPD